MRNPQRDNGVDEVLEQQPGYRLDRGAVADFSSAQRCNSSRKRYGQGICVRPFLVLMSVCCFFCVLCAPVVCAPVLAEEPALEFLDGLRSTLR